MAEADAVASREKSRCPGPSTAEIIRADGDNAPEKLLRESPLDLGDSPIPYERYTSREFHEREMDRMWSRTWQWACREEQAPEVGDYVVYDIGPWSVIVVRSGPDEFRAFHNSCAHRATQLRPPESMGSAPLLRCPYHGWTYGLDGKLETVPCRWDFPHVGDRHNLSPVRCERWGGFVFVNLDSEAAPLSEYLGALPEHLRDGWDLSRRYTTLHIQKELPGNWKAAIEAFLEAYHVVETHADFLPVVCDANAQYDVFGDHVSRFVHTQGVPSPHYLQEQTQQEILERMLVAPKGTQVPEGSTARAVAASSLKASLSEAWHVDLSGYSTSEMLDSIEYFLFPNACFFPGVTLPMVYRFRPLGDRHDRTLFDLLFLRPTGPREGALEPVEPVRIGIGQSFAEVPGMDPTLAHVYDQDTDNLAAQWRGMVAAPRKGQTLGNYQEIRVRHLHHTLDKYLSS
ncbi:hypothetical protein GCM10011371_25650 [Novosphingobium marinum]|uniref:Phenylpropionate dioxygenase-like ring-hydroxylating dioxygenase large terminal subunit n=1 Tax=Novosphingobium marinum TaxID=1514948 RepID=A0A7Z0BUZ5_9SPHN|nr:aromatic ring-hydroxylating dioxygenase subunit alpha [Novosphingobium marinum]NYH94820.1 phenylpropionate dioxygenase-like ring-hydroxylating dioxygenase large terminal subunit [Novosphingobium marinum]GGC37087.1 hypothetical protein GCM10011371_25650 [Novosphingobium marinum]